MQHVKMDEEEENEREELLAEVTDSNYMFGKVDVDAEGEVDTDVVEQGQVDVPIGEDSEIIDPVDVFGE